MKRSKVIGITGSIATGKSAVSKLIKDFGYKVFDSDNISRDLTKKGGSANIEIKKIFGDKYFFQNGELNRKKLAKLIFSDENERKKLNDIIHPLVINVIVESVNSSNEDIIFVDVPLLFEIKDNLKKNGLEFDMIVLVYSNEDTQLERLIQRDGISKNSAIAKIKSQISIEEKIDMSDYIINNNSSMENLRNEVKFFLSRLDEYV